MNATVQSQQRNIQIGFLLATGAALGFSIKAIFVKLAYAYHVDAITMLMFRMMFALPFFIVIVWLEERKAKSRIRRKDFINITLLGLVGYYCSSLLDFMGLMYITTGLERLILFLFPTMVVFISAVFLGKRIQKEAYIALALSYMGIIVAMANDVQISGEHVLLGSALVFVATITYSVFLVGSGKIIPKVGARKFTAYAMIVSCIAVIIQFGITHDTASFNQPVEVYAYGFAMAVFSTVLPAFMLAAAMHRIGASKTSIISGLGPVATIVLAAIFLAEPLTLIQVVGAALVMAGVHILGKSKNK
ncbi:DMT family transporter [Ghiorsea bivora]|uniref:DMT family transporter n=1 Tax=Ghiorsea bivora TaxID=1485545 RepID=UPI00057094EE|nr:DMT family transporter [Ghiorsea bivora]